ncbi:hypothetical protein COCC4DRAFT_29770 [Bipolaris maydis ATCC 48331]|uniref:Uncharacterized protein n=1 Tax=Cochliobolus heterostrophus (strain C4 / ATCC 48331 / race T) TaxID=665024 RepID=N4XDS7_COCH4|nr:uncharacterized protein COCC4DRAFT_29770 [Bipolaris maydis ATCC 48331]ENI09890.1 hypothetical protein COCC4DRAFT_29770 [Bipolaris maydis ATCC 48331]
MLTPYAQKPSLVSKSISGRASPSKRSALRQMSPNRRHTVGASTAEQGDNDITDASAISSMPTLIPTRSFSLTHHLHQGLWQEQVEFLMRMRQARVNYEQCKTKTNRRICWTELVLQELDHLHRRHVTLR